MNLTDLSRLLADLVKVDRIGKQFLSKLKEKLSNLEIPFA